MRFLDLFSGIGGFTLGLERAGMTCVGHVENESYCRKILRKHWPDVPLVSDVQDVKGDSFEQPVDLVCGGPPCQPVSHAGKRRGEEDDRWLWGEALQVVEMYEPAWVLFENPPGILSMGIDGILAELEGCGYEVGLLDIPACAVDAPHLRHRIWILGYSAKLRRKAIKRKQQDELLQGSESGILGYSEGRETYTATAGRLQSESSDASQSKCAGQQPAGQGSWSDYQWIRGWDGKYRRVEPGIRLLADGVPERVDRLRALGNAVVPQVVERIGRVILDCQTHSLI